MRPSEAKGILISAIGLCIALTSGCASHDPNGLGRMRAAFGKAAGSPQEHRATELIKAAEDGRYFTAVSGLQTLRLNPELTVEQITAIQDAIGKMQSRLAEEAANGDAEAAKHVRALQNETEPAE